MVRNIDPFERKKRLSMGINKQAYTSIDAENFSAAKIMSKTEAREERSSIIEKMNPGQYISASQKFYL